MAAEGYSCVCKGKGRDSVTGKKYCKKYSCRTDNPIVKQESAVEKQIKSDIGSVLKKLTPTKSPFAILAKEDVTEEVPVKPKAQLSKIPIIPSNIPLVTEEEQDQEELKKEKIKKQQEEKLRIERAKKIKQEEEKRIQRQEKEAKALQRQKDEENRIAEEVRRHEEEARIKAERYEIARKEREKRQEEESLRLKEKYRKQEEEKEREEDRKALYKEFKENEKEIDEGLIEEFKEREQLDASFSRDDKHIYEGLVNYGVSPSGAVHKIENLKKKAIEERKREIEIEKREAKDREKREKQEQKDREKREKQEAALDWALVKRQEKEAEKLAKQEEKERKHSDNDYIKKGDSSKMAEVGKSQVQKKVGGGSYPAWLAGESIGLIGGLYAAKFVGEYAEKYIESSMNTTPSSITGFVKWLANNFPKIGFGIIFDTASRSPKKSFGVGLTQGITVAMPASIVLDTYKRLTGITTVNLNDQKELDNLQNALSNELQNNVVIRSHLNNALQRLTEQMTVNNVENSETLSQQTQQIQVPIVNMMQSVNASVNTTTVDYNLQTSVPIVPEEIKRKYSFIGDSKTAGNIASMFGML